MSNAIPRFISVLTMVVCSACGSQDPGALGAKGGAGSATQTELMPWKAGNSWTYRLMDGGDAVAEKVTTIGEEEPVGGSGPNAALLANRVVTTNKNGSDDATSWQAKVGDRVVRYREQLFAESTGRLYREEHWDPSKPRIDNSLEHRVEGASWIDEYWETWVSYEPDGTARDPVTSPQAHQWRVEGVGISVTVPAGTFNAIVLRKTTNDKTYYFVPGVGKVKEVGNYSEELVSYVVDP